ncbi:MAG: sodium:solute symporter [Cyclobacteriaceae bacterium]|nr:sodium:solute symporter [Cyclobacteriaceae bacterium HetDA_MAG_MS6]
MVSVYLWVVLAYFAFLVLISKLTVKGASTETFFTANNQSPWYLVAFGMIGASLSGITFISVPGEVGNSKLYYLQLVFGYVVGYFIISYLLIPLYYRLKLTSIYQYLDIRFGTRSNRSGALLFLVSQTLGASLRLFVVANILYAFIFKHYGIPFWLLALGIVVAIWLYTHQGGIKTLVWTDTIQTFLMLLSLAIAMIVVSKELELGGIAVSEVLFKNPMGEVFNWDWGYPKNFVKQFLSGVFIAIVMTGLDQNLMQKHLTCKNIKEAQLNINWFSVVYLFINAFFLMLGLLLYAYVDMAQITLAKSATGTFTNTDDLFPSLALGHFGLVTGVIFMLGIAAAALSSADSAITSLTTSFCYDFLHVKDKSNAYKAKAKKRTHMAFSLVVLLVVLGFAEVKDESAINIVFSIAGYTYGPILGLFTFGIFSSRRALDGWVPLICLLSPVLAHLVKILVEDQTNYRFGFEFLILNGGLTYLGLFLTGILSKNKEKLS